MDLWEHSFLERSSRNWISGERCWVYKSTVDAGLGHIIVGVKVGTVNVGEDSEGKVTSSYTCRCQVR